MTQIPVMRLQGNQETAIQSQERDECISRMTKWPSILKAILRLRKMIGMYPLDLAMWGLLVTMAKEDLVEWLGQRPGWRDLNCLMESEKGRECLLTSLLRSLAERDSREMR